VKTDQRDAVSPVRLLRADELTAVWVPDEQQEAMRDLTRMREDMKNMERRARQRLSSFLLRNKKVYAGESKWIQADFRWMKEVRFESPIEQIVLQEYVDVVKHLQGWVTAGRRNNESACGMVAEARSGSFDGITGSEHCNCYEDSSRDERYKPF